jgi:dihydrofolate reductase
MKTILIFVSTLDGKITRWGEPDIRSWTSKYDQDHFDAIWNETRVVIMGKGTYTPDPVSPGPDHLFVVMTRHPEEYKNKERKGRLEFTSEPAEQLVSRFEKEGETNILVVGGPHIATLFLKNQLIDELWLTFEPRIFGKGGNLVIDEQLDIELKLLSYSKVNDEGTIVTKYQVLKKERL